MSANEIALLLQSKAARPSGSSMERAALCPASFVMQQVRTESTDSSTFGTNVHAYLARAHAVGREQALREIGYKDDAFEPADHYRFCELIPWEKLPQGGRAEVAYAWDWQRDEARDLGTLAEARAYPQEPGLIYCTLDRVGVAGEYAIYVDWKTGYKTLKAARASRQLRFGALCAARAAGVYAAKVAFWRLREDGTFWEDWAEFDCFDLDEIAAEMQGIIRGVLAAQAAHNEGRLLPLATGEHCEHCPAFPVCPAQAQLSREMVAVGSLLPAELTPEIASQIWQKLDQYDEVAERLRKQLKSYAKTTPFPCGVNKELRLTERRFTGKIDPVITMEVLTRRFGAARAAEAAQTVITKSSIDEVCAGVASVDRLKLSDVKAEVYNELHERRAIVTGTTPVVMPAAIKKEKKAK